VKNVGDPTLEPIDDVLKRIDGYVLLRHFDPLER
jgi:hypothetical protein